MTMPTDAGQQLRADLAERGTELHYTLARIHERLRRIAALARGEVG